MREKCVFLKVNKLTEKRSCSSHVAICTTRVHLPPSSHWARPCSRALWSSQTTRDRSRLTLPTRTTCKPTQSRSEWTICHTQSACVRLATATWSMPTSKKSRSPKCASLSASTQTRIYASRARTALAVLILTLSIQLLTYWFSSFLRVYHLFLVFFIKSFQTGLKSIK